MGLLYAVGEGGRKHYVILRNMLGRGKRANFASLYRICVDGERGHSQIHVWGWGVEGWGWGGGQVLFVLVQES